MSVCNNGHGVSLISTSYLQHPDCFSVTSNVLQPKDLQIRPSVELPLWLMTSPQGVIFAPAKHSAQKSPLLSQCQKSVCWKGKKEDKTQKMLAIFLSRWEASRLIGSPASLWRTHIHTLIHVLETVPSCKTVSVLLAVLLRSGGVKVEAVDGEKGPEGLPGTALTQLHVPFKAVALQQLANALLTSKKVSTSTAAAAGAVIGWVVQGDMCWRS